MRRVPRTHPLVPARVGHILAPVGVVQHRVVDSLARLVVAPVAVLVLQPDHRASSPALRARGSTLAALAVADDVLEVTAALADLAGEQREVLAGVLRDPAELPVEVG